MKSIIVSKRITAAIAALALACCMMPALTDIAGATVSTPKITKINTSATSATVTARASASKKYKFQIQQKSGNAYKTVKTTKALSSRTKSFKSLSEGCRYRVRVYTNRRWSAYKEFHTEYPNRIDDSSLKVVTSSHSVRCSWKPVSTAQAYRVSLCDDVILDQYVTKAPNTSFEDLQNGFRYLITIQPISKSGVLSKTKTKKWFTAKHTCEYTYNKVLNLYICSCGLTKPDLNHVHKWKAVYHEEQVPCYDYVLYRNCKYCGEEVSEIYNEMIDLTSEEIQKNIDQKLYVSKGGKICSSRYSLHQQNHYEETGKLYSWHGTYHYELVGYTREKTFDYYQCSCGAHTVRPY